MSKVVPSRTTQPRADPWMSQSQNPSPHVSYGLSLLNSISMMSIQQEASLSQTITGLSAAQRFHIFNEHGQLILNAFEDEGELTHRLCCGANRSIVLHVYDPSNQEVMRISRAFKCCAGCCCWCAGTEYCKYEGIIESPPGVIIGTVRQTGSCYRTHMSLTDAEGSERLKIIGPFCINQGVLCCCCENKFKLTTADDEKEIGGVFKEYAGLVNQALTGAEKYTIKFPMQLPAQLKGLALGALFLINFKHFGGTAKNKGGRSLLSCFC